MEDNVKVFHFHDSVSKNTPLWNFLDSFSKNVLIIAWFASGSLKHHIANWLLRKTYTMVSIGCKGCVTEQIKTPFPIKSIYLLLFCRLHIFLVKTFSLYSLTLKLWFQMDISKYVIYIHALKYCSDLFFLLPANELFIILFIKR